MKAPKLTGVVKKTGDLLISERLYSGDVRNVVEVEAFQIGLCEYLSTY